MTKGFKMKCTICNKSYVEIQIVGRDEIIVKCLNSECRNRIYDSSFKTNDKGEIQ